MPDASTVAARGTPPPPVAAPTISAPNATVLHKQWDGSYPDGPRAVKQGVIYLRHLVYGADPAALEQFTRAWRRGIERAKAELLRDDLLLELGMRA